ncbi:hypothetical protein PMI15_03040 [Polaromonas sp. CF318]|uniref:hypothetical protein n=1 Tax=Polaromonas sp. CF318 TaxID=1144318 RepID=UPI000270E33A|nr:hypothetical protein [Polaromonas sp. CF318]EJL82437.1 hypothetical protein PMI15_03040 [Polaromonas sp. CF318]
MKLFKTAQKFGSTAAAKVAAVGTSLALLGSRAMAQTADPSVLDQFFDAIGLNTVVGKVVAIGLIIVGIALAFKGPDLAKRVIRKV